MNDGMSMGNDGTLITVARDLALQDGEKCDFKQPRYIHLTRRAVRHDAVQHRAFADDPQDSERELPQQIRYLGIFVHRLALGWSVRP